MRRLWWTFAQTLVRPRRAIATITAAPSTSQGLAMTGVFGSLYAAAAFTSYRIGRRPSGRLLTFIPAERYYLWESIFCLPLTLAWMVMFAAAVRTILARSEGSGTFEADLSVLAFCQSAPMIACFWLPDMACYLLRIREDTYLRLVPVYGSVAVTWALALSTAGIASSERISWEKALPAVVIAELTSATASGVALAMR